MKEKYAYSEDYALERNTVYLFGSIDNKMAERIIKQLFYLADKGADEITMHINSVGGEVSAGLAIYDVMQHLKAKIITIGMGVCASMGAVLLSSGSRGYRFATKNCEIMIHQPLGGVRGQATDIILEAENIKHTRDLLTGILSDNTRQVKEKIEKDTERDYTMTAAEAKEYGLIDALL